jgi:prophage tail gpP-like protein
MTQKRRHSKHKSKIGRALKERKEKVEKCIERAFEVQIDSLAVKMARSFGSPGKIWKEKLKVSWKQHTFRRYKPNIVQ